MTVLGIIGGSGIYHVAGLKNEQWRRVASPFGEKPTAPSVPRKSPRTSS